MITGRWGKPTEVLLDISVAQDGVVRGVLNPGRQDASIQRGRFDATTGAVTLDGEATMRDGRVVPFHVDGRLVGRTLRLRYRFGSMSGTADVVRVEEWEPPRRSLGRRLRERVELLVADVRRGLDARTRPTAAENRRRMAERGESLDSITMREANAGDIPALAALHVELWNRTYRTTRGPTVATRTWQWQQAWKETPRREFVLLLEDRAGRLIGFARGQLQVGEGRFDANLNKMYLRWEYHGLGLGRRMMLECARRFAAGGARNFVLHAERSNPTIGFYDRMGGERLLDDHGRFTGAYAWRDLDSLIRQDP